MTLNSPRIVESRENLSGPKSQASQKLSDKYCSIELGYSM